MRTAVLERARVGQRDFETFYRTEYPRVFRAVYLATSDRETAFDATQEAFKRAYARWWRLARHDWAGGWVMTTALNASKRAWRTSAREVPDEGSPARTHPAPTARRVDLAAALRQLPTRQRTAVVLHYLGDQPLHAVADVMGVSEGTVKAHLAQARKKLRDALEVVDV